MSLAGLPDSVGDETIPLDWRCLECERTWSTTAVADVCCPDCGAERTVATLTRTIQGASA